MLSIGKELAGIEKALYSTTAGVMLHHCVSIIVPRERAKTLIVMMVSSVVIRAQSNSLFVRVPVACGGQPPSA